MLNERFFTARKLPSSPAKSTLIPSTLMIGAVLTSLRGYEASGVLRMGGRVAGRATGRGGLPSHRLASSHSPSRAASGRHGPKWSWRRTWRSIRLPRSPRRRRGTCHRSDCHAAAASAKIRVGACAMRLAVVKPSTTSPLPLPQRRPAAQARACAAADALQLALVDRDDIGGKDDDDRAALRQGGLARGSGRRPSGRTRSPARPKFACQHGQMPRFARSPAGARRCRCRPAKGGHAGAAPTEPCAKSGWRRPARPARRPRSRPWPECPTAVCRCIRTRPHSRSRWCADAGFSADRPRDQRVDAAPDAKGIGQQHRGFQRAQFRHLHQAGAFCQSRSPPSTAAVICPETGCRAAGSRR